MFLAQETNRTLTIFLTVVEVHRGREKGRWAQHKPHQSPAPLSKLIFAKTKSKKGVDCIVTKKYIKGQKLSPIMDDIFNFMYPQEPLRLNVQS